MRSDHPDHTDMTSLLGDLTQQPFLLRQQYQPQRQQRRTEPYPAQRRNRREEPAIKKFRCDHEGCHKAFSKSDHLKTHKRTHTGERPYQCETCPKGFSDLANLKRHMRIHTGLKPFMCDNPGCGKRFSVSSNLKQHKRTHTGERPYSCDYCSKTFSHVSSRRKHMASHSEEMQHCAPPTTSRDQRMMYPMLGDQQQAHPTQPYSLPSLHHAASSYSLPQGYPSVATINTGNAMAGQYDNSGVQPYQLNQNQLNQNHPSIYNSPPPAVNRLYEEVPSTEGMASSYDQTAVTGTSPPDYGVSLSYDNNNGFPSVSSATMVQFPSPYQSVALQVDGSNSPGASSLSGTSIDSDVTLDDVCNSLFNINYEATLNESSSEERKRELDEDHIQVKQEPIEVEEALSAQHKREVIERIRQYLQYGSLP